MGALNLMRDACGYESSRDVLLPLQKRQFKGGSLLCHLLGSGSASVDLPFAFGVRILWG